MSTASTSAFGIGVREQDREAARPGAQVERGRDFAARSPTYGARPSGSSSAMNERGIITRSST